VEPLICTKQECTFAKDGKCIDGYAPPDCPNLRAPFESEVSSLPVSEEVYIDLPLGEELDLNGAAEIMGASLSRVIVVAGDVNSGETTLIAALYDKFNEAPFANYLFAGSKTLVAMERRSHLARLTSGALRPNTERTPVTNI
jgi:hypothetical protein